MSFIVVLAFLPLFGLASAAAVTALREGVPGQGAVFTIEGQGDQAYISIDGERRPINTAALERLGFDVSTENLPVISFGKAGRLTLGTPLTVEIIESMIAQLA